MTPATLGWVLAAVFFAVAVQQYGWRGGVVAATFIVFWLLLQFNRAVRVLRRAGDAPIGHVDNVVALHAKLSAGLNMAQVLALTRSLGERLPGDEETFRWRDPGDDTVTLWFQRGRLQRWQLDRAAAPEPAGPGDGPPHGP